MKMWSVYNGRREGYKPIDAKITLLIPLFLYNGKKWGFLVNLRGIHPARNKSTNYFNAVFSYD